MTSAEDVSTTIKFFTSNGIPFTTVGGAHSTSGSSALEDGGIIDLRKMRKVTVDPSAKTITAQGGANWAEVDAAGMQHGLATPGGTVNHTGIGGLTLGGGLGYLSGRHGLVVDNLLQVTMVLADGRIVKVSADSEPDLFWAIRGAGQCFGVATEFVYRAHEQRREVFSGPMVWTPDKLPQIVETLNSVLQSGDPDTGMLVGITAPPPQNQPVLITVLFHNGPEERGKEIFKSLLDLEPLMNGTGMHPYEQVNQSMNEGQGYGGRKLFGGSNFKVPLKVEFVEALFAEFTSISLNEEYKANESAILFEAIPGVTLNKVSNDAMAYANRGDFYSFGLIWKWYDAALDSKMRQLNRYIADYVRNNAGTTNASDVGQYANYLGPEERTERVFGANGARLKELKAKYDPDNWFNKWHNLLPMKAKA